MASQNPVFVGGSHLKSDSRLNLEHLRNDLLPAIKEFYPNNSFIFIQDTGTYHRAKIVQNVLREELKSRFVANTKWPPSSPDCNPLDYYFWNEIKEKMYIGHHAKPFESEKGVARQDLLFGTNVLKILNCFVKQLNSFV